MYFVVTAMQYFIGRKTIVRMVGRGFTWRKNKKSKTEDFEVGKVMERE
jgi:hypothetical protein